MIFPNTFIWISIVFSLFYEIRINSLEVNTSSADFEGDTNDRAKLYQQESKNEPRTDMWVAQIFEKAKQNFQMDSVSPGCHRDMQLYLQNLRNQTVWAVRMMESSGWPTGALFSGELYYLGQYDECVSIVVNDPHLKGQYCLAKAHYGLPPNVQVNPDNMTFIPNQWSSVWQAIHQYKLYDPSRVDRTKVTFAQCLPSSCTPAELERALNATLWPLFHQNGLQFDISVPAGTCTSAEDETFTPPPTYFVVKRFLLTLFAALMACTLYDFLRPKRMKGNEKATPKTAGQTIALYFSIARNIRVLGRVESSEGIGILRLLKVLMIFFVIYGHRFIYFLGYPGSTAETAEIRYQNIQIELVHTNVVDVFFMISGFLTLYFGLRPMKKAPALYIPLSIIVRWIRMVPVFLFMAILLIYMIPYWGEGPFWNQRVGLEAGNCARTLWSNLLAINNFVDTQHQCLVVSWYISVDLQLCVLGTILLFFFAMNEKVGLVLTLVTLFGSFVTTFTVAYINQYHGLLRLYINMLANPRMEPEFNDFYIQPYTRIGPYLIGFLAAYTVQKLKERNYTITKKQIWIGSILSLIFGELSQYYGMIFYKFNRPYNRIESALYATLNRSLFASWGAWLTIILMNRKLGWFGRFALLKFFVPLDRLTYSAFLVNTVVQMYHAASQISPLSSPNKLNIYWTFMGDILLSYLVGLILHVSVEAPITNLCKFLQITLIKLTTKKNPRIQKDVEAQVKQVDASNTSVENIHNDEKVKFESETRGDMKKAFTNEAYQNEDEYLSKL